MKKLRVEDFIEVTAYDRSNHSHHSQTKLNGITGLPAGTLLKRNFTKQITGFLKDWKIYSETGDISDTTKSEVWREVWINQPINIANHTIKS